MKIARLAVLGVALVAGLLAWVLARNVGGGEGPAEVVVHDATETAQVLVVARDIQPGQALSAADLTWTEWPSDAVNPVFVTRDARPEAVRELAGSVARGAFASGEPVREVKLVQAGRGGYLAAILPPGMRAVATRTSPQTGAGGFILPNDRVDVILTRPDDSHPDPATETYSRFASERILENVRVLAIDQTVEEQDGRSVVVGNVATLELRPDQVETLARAEQLGDLSLALRSILDGGSDAGQAQAVEGGTRAARSVNVVKFGTRSRVHVN